MSETGRAKKPVSPGTRGTSLPGRVAITRLADAIQAFDDIERQLQYALDGDQHATDSIWVETALSVATRMRKELSS